MYNIKSKNALIAGVLEQYKPSTVLDVGYAQNPNPELRGLVYGVDIVRVPVPDNYASTYTVDLNTTRIPMGDGSTDAVTMGCTLAHVANPLKVLAEINRVLKPGGVLVVSSPNPNYYWETVMNVFYHFFKKRVSRAKHLEHFFEFSRFNMRTIADRTGFEVVREIGCTFALVMTHLTFDVQRLPGIAYEIIYVIEKTTTPASYATFESAKGIEKIPTDLYS